MRTRKKKNKPYPIIAALISQNYIRLMDACDVSDKSYGCMSKEDIFSETVWHVIHDDKALSCKNVNAFVDHFKFRYRMIEFQTIQDYRQLKEIHYADYLQAFTEEYKEE